MGNLFQQLYNFVDTMIVGYFLGVEALAGVGACIAGPLAWVFADAFLFPAYFYVMKTLEKRMGLRV